MSDEGLTAAEAYEEAERRIAAALEDSEQTFLDLSDLGLSSLPPSLAKLTKISELDCSFNELTELPEWIGKITSLQTLDLSGNQLNDLPRSFANLKNLTELKLGDANFTSNNTSDNNCGNPLRQFPDILRSLPQLDRLDLDYCELSVLPSWISELA